MIDNKVPYPVVVDNNKYIALVPKRFLRPLFIMLPDERVFMQKQPDGIWQEVTQEISAGGTTSFGLTVYPVEHTDVGFVVGTGAIATPSKGQQVVFQIQHYLRNATLMLPAQEGEQGDVYVYHMSDTAKLSCKGRWEYPKAVILTMGLQKVIPFDSENELAGLWVRHE